MAPAVTSKVICQGRLSSEYDAPMLLAIGADRDVPFQVKMRAMTHATSGSQAMRFITELKVICDAAGFDFERYIVRPSNTKNTESHADELLTTKALTAETIIMTQ